MVSIARSIAEVVPDLEWVEIRGSVQTVFPARACSGQSLEESETQEGGGIYHDNFHPMEEVEEEYQKVLKVTLRDLGAGPGYLHRINAYFYDALADTWEGVKPGNEIAISGPGNTVVAREVPAGTGDHPFCLVLRENGAKQDVTVGAGTSDGGALAQESVKVSIVTNAVEGDSTAGVGVVSRGRNGRNADEGDGDGNGDGSASNAGDGINLQSGHTRHDKSSYKYTNLNELKVGDARVNVYGVVCSFSHRHQSKGRDMTACVSLVDESQPNSDDAVSCNFFVPTRDGLPAPLMVGDIMRVHRAKLQEYKGRAQLLGIQGASWLVVHKKKTVREAFQKAFPSQDGSSSARAAGDAPNGAGSDEDLEPDEGPQRSEPDAGGGKASSAMPGPEWEIHASSANYTIYQSDQKRFNALSEWFTTTAPQTWLQNSDQKLWVQDIFLRPQGPGDVVVKTEVDLVCCLASKHEQSGGGAGSLSLVYVADGSGFDAFVSSKAHNSIHNAALLKAMRFALGKRDWRPPLTSGPATPTPGAEGEKTAAPRVPVVPVTAFLRIEVREHRKEWEALALSPGMWIRLRRLTVCKNRKTGTMTATMKDRGSSVNPLHPSMAEVKAIANAYVARCSRHAALPAIPENTRVSPNAGSAAISITSVTPQMRRHGEEEREGVVGTAVAKQGTKSPVSGWQVPSSPSDPSGGERQQSARDNGMAALPTRRTDGSGVEVENEVRRGTKRPLSATDSGSGAAEDRVSPLAWNLLSVRSTPAPRTFDVRVRVVGHFPIKVEEFVREGPGSRGGLGYLFALCLQDVHGTIDAVVAGLHAKRLLPGNPSPEEFRSNKASRRRVEEALAKLEGGSGPTVELRIRSYVTPCEDGDSKEGSRRSYGRALQLMEAEIPLQSHRWLDIGTGSGLLASLAASFSCGSPVATEVYACEAVEEVVQVAAQTFKRNSKRNIQLFRCRSTELEVGDGQMPSRATHVVSELLGTGLLDEGVISTMRHAKMHLLQPGFVSVPHSAEVWAFLCESEELAKMSRLAEGNPGVAVPCSEVWLRCPGAAAPAAMHVRPPRWGCVGFQPLSLSERLFNFDFTNLPDSRGRQHGLRFAVAKTGSINAVVCWWQCFMDKDRAIGLDTAPREYPSVPVRNHWRQSVYLMPRPIQVTAGEVVETVAYHDDDMIWFSTLRRREVPEPVAPDADSPGTLSGQGKIQETLIQENRESEAVAISTGPPVCLCGLHRTFSQSRIWMLNDEKRTETIRRALRAAVRLVGDLPGQRAQVCVCVSDGFLLPLLAAQEGVTDVIEIPSSVPAHEVCQELYRANDVADKIRAFPGRITSTYDLLSLPSRSADNLLGVGKVDAVMGEPFFADLDGAWSLESLLLFWCVRTALEGSGYFSPRTRVLPSYARLLACPFECDLLFRGRSRVGMVEGIDMSAVNDYLGIRNEEEGASGHVQSVMLQEYPHVLLGPPVPVLDMDLTRQLCDLNGDLNEITCNLERKRAATVASCHGIALWLELWLDEEGLHKLSTGPEVGFWRQGLVFFKHELLVHAQGRKFNLRAILEDGAFRLDLS